METCHTTEAEKMARTWFGEIPSSCSLTLLLGPAWVLLKYVLQAIFSGPVLTHARAPTLINRKVATVSSCDWIHSLVQLQNSWRWKMVSSYKLRQTKDDGFFAANFVTRVQAYRK